MSLPFPLPIGLYRGATFHIDFDWIGVDLTGASLRCVVRRRDTAEILLDMSTANGKIVVTVDTSGGVTSSTVKATDSATNTLAIPARLLVADYDMLVTYAGVGAKTDPLLRGEITITDAVTY